MARFVSQTLTLIRTTAAIRRISTQPKIVSFAEISMAESEARTVEKIEDVIHNIIVKRSKPDWLPFVPGASYWVPPRRTSYGVAEIVHQLSNPLHDEECLAVTTLQGYPSSDFYIYNDESSHSDSAEEGVLSPTVVSSTQEEAENKED